MRAWNVPSSSGFRQGGKAVYPVQHKYGLYPGYFREYAQNSGGILFPISEENVLAGINLTQAQEGGGCLPHRNHREDLGEDRHLPEPGVVCGWRN